MVWGSPNVSKVLPIRTWMWPPGQALRQQPQSTAAWVLTIYRYHLLPSFAYGPMAFRTIQNAFNTMNIFQTISARLASAEACWHTIARFCKLMLQQWDYHDYPTSSQAADQLHCSRHVQAGSDLSQIHVHKIPTLDIRIAHVLQIFRNVYKLVDEVFGAFLSFHPAGTPAVLQISAAFLVPPHWNLILQIPSNRNIHREASNKYCSWMPLKRMGKNKVPSAPSNKILPRPLRCVETLFLKCLVTGSLQLLSESANPSLRKLDGVGSLV